MSVEQSTSYAAEYDEQMEKLCRVIDEEERRALKLRIIEILQEQKLVYGGDYHELRIKMFGTDTNITHARFKKAVNEMVYGSRRHSPDLRVEMLVTRNHGGLCDPPTKTYNLLPEV